MLLLGQIFVDPPTITSPPAGALTPGTEDQAYSVIITATGTGTLTFSINAGTLPAGITLDSNTGIISGTTSDPANYYFTVRVTDTYNQHHDRDYSLTINAVSRPASTTMLLIADSDDTLDLTGSAINAFHEQIQGLVDFTNEFGGTKWSRQTAVLDGKNVARTGGDFIEYSSPNTADGKLDAWIASSGDVAPEGCLVLVFYPTAVDNGKAWLSSRVNLNIEGGMINDGEDKFRFRIRNTGGGMEGPSVACALNTWHYAIMRWNTTHVYLSIDGGAESSVALSATGGCSNMNNRIEILGDSGSGEGAKGDFMELSIIDPADIANMISFLESEYPTLA